MNDYRRRLQIDLKEFRAMGYDLQVDLRSSYEVLNEEWNRITDLIESEDLEEDEEEEEAIELDEELELEEEEEEEGLITVNHFVHDGEHVSICYSNDGGFSYKLDGEIPIDGFTNEYQASQAARNRIDIINNPEKKRKRRIDMMKLLF